LILAALNRANEEEKKTRRSEGRAFDVMISLRE